MSRCSRTGLAVPGSGPIQGTTRRVLGSLTYLQPTDLQTTIGTRLGKWVAQEVVI